MQTIPRIKRSTLVGVLVLCLWISITLALYVAHATYDTHSNYRASPKLSNFASKAEWTRSRWFQQPASRHHIALASTSGSSSDSDILLPLAWIFKKLLGKPYQSVNIYKEQSGKDYVSAMHDGGMHVDTDFIKPSQLIHDMESDTLFPHDPGAMIDILVLGTCEIDLQRHHPELLNTWDERPIEKRFTLVCIAHSRGPMEWFHILGHWAQRGALRLVTTSNHATRDLEITMGTLADSSDPNVSKSLFEYLTVETFYPMITVKRATPEVHLFKAGRHISNVAFLGDFRNQKKHYQNLFQDLLNLLEEFPVGMGYAHSTSPDTTYQRDLNTTIPPLKLHMIGDGPVELPASLRYVVDIHRDLDYPDLLQLVQSMDAVIPGVTDDAQFDSHTSSAIQIAVSCGIPLLTTHRLRAAYTYIDDDRLVITRPQAVRDADAIFALRTGSTRHIRNDFRLEELNTSLRRMMLRGWRTSAAYFYAVQTKVLKYDQDIVWRLLRDLP
ncbi:hypothetical protein FRB96_009203 [Tulasnella sp. 330]|nr:hypothetical protein FRB96_009203 [Tulasnella sp. 330]KAG8878042.1 hypothetical protein FRB97_002829 [Tulasnella sp. 331]KAG8884098.1 hypothetical protein FRB98_002623 [Tulasnella sp. 332]